MAEPVSDSDTDASKNVLAKLGDNVTTILGYIAAILATGASVWGFYASAVTTPEHGILLDYRRFDSPTLTPNSNGPVVTTQVLPTEPSATRNGDPLDDSSSAGAPRVVQSEPHVERILHYAIRNPGPGVLENITLRVDLPEAFDSYDVDKDIFSNNLRIGTVGTTCSHKVEPSEGRARVVVTPRKHDSAPIELAPGATFGVKLIAYKKDFQPIKVEIHGLDTNPIPVNRDLLQFSHSSVGVYRAIGILGVLFLVLLWVGFLYGKWQHSRGHSIAEEAASKQKAKWRELGRANAFEDIENAELLVDGATESDKWESLMTADKA